MTKNGKQVVFAQGMRRSGTTIVFDLMLEDGRYECFYEPLAATKPAFGGGSAMHSNVDLFDNVRTAREEFVNQNPQLMAKCPRFLEHNFLNYGAPRLPALEFEPELPRFCRDYIRHMTDASPRTFLKFTRMHSKVHCLKEIAPEAKFIHIVRDPRHVVSSYLFGKKSKFRPSFEEQGDYFSRVSDMSRWSSRAFSDFILTYEGMDDSEPFQDFLRILAIWKYKFDTTYRQGRDAFGENFFLLRHEDLLENPAETIESIYGFLGIEPSVSVLNWAAGNLRQPSAAFKGTDSSWIDAFDRISMWDALEESGYAERIRGEVNTPPNSM
jgi:hypothetical protein